MFDFILNNAVAGTAPIQGTEIATQWDSLYNFLIGLSVFFFLIVVGGMVYFAIKYRHQKGLRTKYITGNHQLEIIWTVIPTILLIIIFIWGYYVYRAMIHAPPGAYEIRVIAKQWGWQFQYEDGRISVGEVFVPVNQPVKMVMSSEDVIHSLFIPNFRIKQDVVPGMYTTVWFEATVPGKHQILCAEYCGTSHSEMLAKLYVLEPDEWKEWLTGKKPVIAGESGSADGKKSSHSNLSKLSSGIAVQGKKLANAKGCVGCHTSDGSTKIGPTYKGIFGQKVELADGTSSIIDDNYIRESIENPQAKVVRGFAPVMPSFKGLLIESEINALVAYIKSLK
jgi:cytochrome c oxidase subunit 2